MSWAADTLEAFKAWLGATTPPATDAQLTAALELALVTVETWLDRPLESLERVQEDAEAGAVIRLRAWPVDAVASIVAHGKALELEHVLVDKRTGRLGLGGCYGLTVTTYTGGFAPPFPADLTLALWLVAAELVPAVMSAGGVDASQAVRRVTTPDVGTVEYASSSAGGGAARPGDALLGGTLPPQAESLLARYRAESIVGGA